MVRISRRVVRSISAQITRSDKEIAKIKTLGIGTATNERTVVIKY
jgi:hypothetical protein